MRTLSAKLLGLGQWREANVKPGAFLPSLLPVFFLPCLFMLQLQRHCYTLRVLRRYQDAVSRIFLD